MRVAITRVPALALSVGCKGFGAIVDDDGVLSTHGSQIQNSTIRLSAAFRGITGVDNRVTSNAPHPDARAQMRLPERTGSLFESRWRCAF
jgi:hypothetical protein